MTAPNVTITMPWHVAQWWDRICCHMLNQPDLTPDMHRALLDTHHALADAIVDKTCINCGTRPTRRRTSTRLCDACHTYTQLYGNPPNHDILDRRDGPP